MENLVSIIVPIYNVEKYVARCIGSLMQQEYTNIEIILVDDGSPDRCGQIVDEYARKDPRIQVIHKANGGVSAARNDGLKNAAGKYIMFVDGDDYVERDYVSYFVELIEKNGCEMAVSTRSYTRDGQPQETENQFVSGSDWIAEQIYLNQIGVAVWNKIYDRSVLIDNEISFDTRFWFAEGMLFNIYYLQSVARVSVGQRRVYHCVENMNSATRLFNLDSFLCGLRSMELQKEIWKSPTQDIQMAWEYHYRRYAELIMQGLICSGKVTENQDIFDKCGKALKTNLRIPLQVKISTWAKTRAICLAIDPMLVIKTVIRYGQCKHQGEKARLFIIKIINKTPLSMKRLLFQLLEQHYKRHYRPVYLTKKLL